MSTDPTTCYRALTARDRRFDGVFFVGVTTTGIYCRPVCPARLPARDRCRFFGHAGAAEAAGFRPCLRCRPERAPGRAIVDASRNLAERAAARIGAGALNEGGVDDLAAELHVGPRQLRRTMKREFGATPVQLAQTHRLLLAKRLLTESSLPVTQVAFASGFSSLRRFNALFKKRYRMSPSRLRRDGGGAGPDQESEGSEAGASPEHESGGSVAGASREQEGGGSVAGASREQKGGGSVTGTAPDQESGGFAAAPLTLTLEYRAPYDWEALLAFLAARTVPGLEIVEESREATRYLRTMSIGEHRGWVAARPAPDGTPALEVEVSLSLLPVLMLVLTRLRSLFDLDAEPETIRAHLEDDPVLAPRLRRRPGLRVPGAADGFELAWRAILGQQVSVRAARTLAGRFAEAFGEAAPASAGLPDGLVRFPARAEVVSEAGPERIRELGVTGSRSECIHRLAQLVAERGVVLDPGADVEGTMSRLQSVKGIGPWTARYIALRALHWPDAFPDGDLGLRQAMGGASASDLRRAAEPWRPWRAYAALHLWQGLADSDEA